MSVSIILISFRIALSHHAIYNSCSCENSTSILCFACIVTGGSHVDSNICINLYDAHIFVSCNNLVWVLSDYHSDCTAALGG